MDERRSQNLKLPSFLQPSARELWRSRPISTGNRPTNLVLGNYQALYLGASGIASMSSEQKEWQEDPEIEVETDSSAEVVEEKIEEIVTQSQPEPEEAVAEEPADNQAGSEGLTIFSMVESFSQARMLSEQNALKEELSVPQSTFLSK